LKTVGRGSFHSFLFLFLLLLLIRFFLFLVYGV
jgi:hypothetical protein